MHFTSWCTRSLGSGAPGPSSRKPGPFALPRRWDRASCFWSVGSPNGRNWQFRRLHHLAIHALSWEMTVNGRPSRRDNPSACASCVSAVAHSSAASLSSVANAKYPKGGGIGLLTFAVFRWDANAIPNGLLRSLRREIWITCALRSFGIDPPTWSAYAVGMSKKPPIFSPNSLEKIAKNVAEKSRRAPAPKPTGTTELHSVAEGYKRKLVKEALEKEALEKEALEKEALEKEALEKRAKFNEKVVEEAFKKSGGRCQCRRKECDVKHRGQCPKKDLKWGDRGTSDNPNAWQAHHRHAEGKGGADTVSNCEILCVPCHKSTDSYGG